MPVTYAGTDTGDYRGLAKPVDHAKTVWMRFRNPSLLADGAGQFEGRVILR